MIKIENDELEALREILAVVVENVDRGWGEENPQDLIRVEALDHAAQMNEVTLDDEEVRILKSICDMEWGDVVTNYHGFVSLQEKINAATV